MSMTRLHTRLLLFVLLLIPMATGWAADGSDGMAWGQMAMGLFGGLALFLYGMELMTEALKIVAGDRLQGVLARLTSNRFAGVATGAAVTAVIQSSSVTTVLVVGFVASHFMSLSQAIGVIMGANIGTTITGQIIAFKVTKYALAMLAVGFAMYFLCKRERVIYSGQALFGLGMIFFGMAVMGDAMQPLRSYQPFLDLMLGMENPLMGIAIAALFTALVQSSSATTGIVIVMAGQGFITLPAGIALSLGANVGTCVTAMLASIGKSREALRAAVAHVLFNILGVLIWVGLIDYLAELAVWLSPATPGLSGAELLATDAPRQIANANTLFNLLNTLIFIGFVTHLAHLVRRLVPDKARTEEGPRPRYLDNLLLDSPNLALDAVRRELPRIGRRVQKMLEASIPAVLAGTRQSLNEVAKMDNEVDALHGHIIKFLGELNKRELSESQGSELLALTEAANVLENIGDVIETNLVTLGYERIDQGLKISNQTRKVITQVYEEVAEHLDTAVDAVLESDLDKARQVIASKRDVYQMIEEAYAHQMQRLIAPETGRLAAYTLEKDILDKLRWIFYFARRVAKSVRATSDKKQSTSDSVGNGTA